MTTRPLPGEPPPSSLSEFALAKLARVMGREKAEGLLREVMAANRMSALDSPQELLVLASGLIARGGFAAVVGRSLKVYAILRGAVAL